MERVDGTARVGFIPAIMTIARPILRPALFLPFLFLLPSCAGLPGESPEHMRERIARQDVLVDRHQEKRKIRSEAADRRYNQSWNNAMGRSNDPEAWPESY